MNKYNNINDLIVSVVNNWCEVNQNVLGITDWEAGYTNYPSPELHNSDISDIMNRIISEIKLNGFSDKEVSFYSGDCDICYNDYFGNDVKFIEKVTSPPIEFITDYTDIHIFEIENGVPITSKNINELETGDIPYLVDKYLEPFRNN